MEDKRSNKKREVEAKPFPTKVYVLNALLKHQFFPNIHKKSIDLPPLLSSEGLSKEVAKKLVCKF